MEAKLRSYRDLYLSGSSFLKMGLLKMASWHFELRENTKSFQAHGKIFGKHIRLFRSNLVELTSAEVISN